MPKKAKRTVPTRTWRGLPMREGNVHIFIRAVEEDGGVPHDPNNCRVANALRRMFPGAAVAVYKTVTLVETVPGTMDRFKNDAALRKGVAEFDKTGTMPTGTYVLEPIPAGRTLEARSAENRARRDARRGRPRPVVTGTGTGNGKVPTLGRGTYATAPATP